MMVGSLRLAGSFVFVGHTYCYWHGVHGVHTNGNGKMYVGPQNARAKIEEMTRFVVTRFVTT